MRKHPHRLRPQPLRQLRPNRPLPGQLRLRRRPRRPCPSIVTATATATGRTGEMKTTPSGLKYQVIKQGTGTVSPKPTDTVKVHYHGTLLNGTVFDSSVQRGDPATFRLNQVIAGVDRGAPTHESGRQVQVRDPFQPRLRATAQVPDIPPNSTLFSKWNSSGSSRAGWRVP